MSDSMVYSGSVGNRTNRINSSSNQENDMSAHTVEYVVIECLDHSFVAYDLVDHVVCMHVHHFN